jgi:hypothetical protein
MNYQIVICQNVYNINNSKIPKHLLKYKYLRHALSHGDPIKTETKNNIDKYFGPTYFVFKNGRFDYDSSTNIQNLSIQARDFMKEMLKAYRK